MTFMGAGGADGEGVVEGLAEAGVEAVGEAIEGLGFSADELGRGVVHAGV